MTKITIRFEDVKPTDFWGSRNVEVKDFMARKLAEISGADFCEAWKKTRGIMRLFFEYLEIIGEKMVSGWLMGPRGIKVVGLHIVPKNTPTPYEREVELETL